MGDHGNILWNGFTENVRRKRPQPAILVYRTGSFVPPITVPFGHVLVTDDFRQKLIAEAFSGLSFDPLGYAKVVQIECEQRDANAQEPAFYPDAGERYFAGAEITDSVIPSDHPEFRERPAYR